MVDEDAGVCDIDAADSVLVAADGDGEGGCGEELEVGVEFCADDWGR